MGCFKELSIERCDGRFFDEIDMSLESLERELEVVDLKIAIIDSECFEMEKELNLLLPSFVVNGAFFKPQFNLHP